jgi:peroxiredoxin
MKKLLLISPILALTFVTDLNAQLPEKPEDISPLLVGETFPDLKITGLDGASISFHEIIKEKPTVLIFYRGGWCPYCNRHLSAIGQVEADILELGYQVVAVSPDKMEKLRETVAKDELNYRLFSDASGELAKAAGIAFQAPERYGQRLLDWSGGENTGFLPVPSVFILDTKGEILFEYINPNYKKRLDAELLLAVLKALPTETD